MTIGVVLILLFPPQGIGWFMAGRPGVGLVLLATRPFLISAFVLCALLLEEFNEGWGSSEEDPFGGAVALYLLFELLGAGLSALILALNVPRPDVQSSSLGVLAAEAAPGVAAIIVWAWLASDGAGWAVFAVLWISILSGVGWLSTRTPLGLAVGFGLFSVRLFLAAAVLLSVPATSWGEGACSERSYVDELCFNLHR